MITATESETINLQTKADTIQKNTYYLTVFFTFSGIFALPKGHEIIGGLVTLSIVVGLYNYIKNKKYNTSTNLYISFALIFYAFVILFNYSLHGDWIRIAKSFLFVFLFYSFMPHLKNIRVIVQSAIVLGSLLIGAISMYQYNSGHPRPDGFTNAILFSQASLVLFLFNIYFFKLAPNLKIKSVFVISSMFSIIALYLSQSRGAWLALIALMVVFLAINIIKKPKENIILVLFACMFLAALLTQSNIVNKKIQAGISDLTQAKHGQYNSSWGLRLVAWQSAWLGIKENPVFGVGKNNFHSNKAEQVADGKVTSLALDPALAHAHNQYLHSTLIRGAFGFIALILILSIPFIVKSDNLNSKCLGVSIGASYAIFGLSDVPFEHLNTTYLYSLSLIIIYSLLDKGKAETQS